MPGQLNAFTRCGTPGPRCSITESIGRSKIGNNSNGASKKDQQAVIRKRMEVKRFRQCTVIAVFVVWESHITNWMLLKRKGPDGYELVLI